MDWSLVLVSQGIESVIENEPEAGGWGLVVAGQDSEKAFKVLRQYKIENRGWPWRQPLAGSETGFHWGSIGWVVLLAFFHVITGTNPELKERGEMISTAVEAGQWWRIFTAIMLHADVAHLAANLTLGLLLWGLVMGRFGGGMGLLGALLAGAGGNVASLLLNEKPFAGLGASGMVMGALGLLSVQTMHRANWNRQSFKYTFTAVAAGVMLFVLYGVAPGSDMVAHLGGFVCGLVLGIAMSQAPAGRLQSFKINLAGWLVLSALLVTVWWLAAVHR